MNRESLAAGYRRLLDRLYAPGPYNRRIRVFLREFRPLGGSGAVTLRNLRAALGAGVSLGVIGRGRFHFWGLLLWTCFRRPRLIPTALALSIYGLHFRKCCEALGA